MKTVIQNHTCLRGVWGFQYNFGWHGDRTQVTSTSGMFPRFLEVTQACQFSSTQCTLDSFSSTCSIRFCVHCTNFAMNVYFKRCVRPCTEAYATVGFTWTNWEDRLHSEMYTYWTLASSILFSLFVYISAYRLAAKNCISLCRCRNSIASKRDQHLTLMCIDSTLVPLRPLTCTDLPLWSWSIVGRNFSEWVQIFQGEGNFRRVQI